MRALLLIFVLVVPAHAAVEPARIVRHDEPVRASAGTSVARGALVFHGIALLGVCMFWRSREPDVLEFAFERLAQGHKAPHLTDDDRRLIRSLAHDRAVAPASMLLCPSVLREQVEASRRTTSDPGTRAHLQRIEHLLLA